MARQREKQLGYSDIQDQMLNEEGRRTKAAKIVNVVTHFLGRDRLDGLTVVDVGCSVGFVCDSMRDRGAHAIGVDIDVPGLARASERFGNKVLFLCADGERLPLPDESADVIVFNHIYEHVVDPFKVMADMRRVLKPGGMMYLGLGNKLGIVEPHYKLPFLSYLPPSLADRYVKAFKRADFYHERFLTRAGLKRLCRGLYVTEYTYALIAEADRFNARDVVPPLVDKLPAQALVGLQPIIPTFVWVATKQPLSPKGAPLSLPPRRVPTGR